MAARGGRVNGGRAALAGAALAGVLLAVGCGRDTGHQPAAAAAPLTAAEAGVLDRAEERLIAGCMRQHGFRYWESPHPGAGEQPPEYVLTDVAAAGAHGYRNASVPTNAELAADPNLRYVHGLPADQERRYSTTLNGSLARDRQINVRVAGGTVIGRGTDGCVADAERSLYGDLAAWSAASVQVDDLTSRIPPRVLTDRRYLRAQSAWAGCMRAAGQPYRSPGDIRQKLGALAATPAAEHAAETRVAVAEAGCAQRTNLGRVAAAVDRELRDALAPADRAAVQAYRQLQRAALPRAQAVLAG
jgi:hypothetical protein